MDGVVKRLPLTTIEQRARRIRLLLTDVDGVLTDGSVYYGENGEAYKRFSLRDGMGVERLREAGIDTGFITRESSPIVQQRANKLRLRYCFTGIHDKAGFLETIIRETSLRINELAYIGDDVNDLSIMETIGEHGLIAAPLDAMPEIVCRVHYHCRQEGGRGAFRDFVEWLLLVRRDDIKISPRFTLH